ncbi:MAG: hypothetical protein ACJAS2_001033 [Pseudohongiellaceae bacterium]|jgi:hypothetical protein
MSQLVYYSSAWSEMVRFQLPFELLSVPASALVCVNKQLKEARESIMK